MTLQELNDLIHSDKKVNVILDTDTYNEVDDQFCLTYLMKADRINLKAVTAAPFLNRRSESPKDGMEKSYNEILKIMKLVEKNAKIPAYRGSDRYLESKEKPVESEAIDAIAKIITETEEPVIIVAIGCITNVASALIKCPEIAKKSALIWLGGHSLHNKDTKEFNMVQDIPAAQVVFDSDIPLLQIPCHGVCTEFVTTPVELDYYLKGKNEVCDYLCDIVRRECGVHTEHVKKHGCEKFAVSRIVWDVTAAASILCPRGCHTVQIPKPIITDDGHYAFDLSRPHYLYTDKLERDFIFGDLFYELAK